jgi:glycosyltransferase involved in cell wall biosynthesis
MKLLVLSSGFPYPVDAGRKLVLAGFLDFAVGALGPDKVMLVCISGDKAERDAIHLAPCRTIFLKPPFYMLRLVNVLLYSIVLRQHAIQEMLVAASGIESRVDGLVAEFGPDIIFIDTIRMVGSLRSELRRRCRSVLYLDDLYSLRYLRMIEAMNRFPDAELDPLGTFGRFLPWWLPGVARIRGLQRFLLAFESTLLARREKAMPGLFDTVLLLNRVEVTALSAKAAATNVVTIKPLIPERIIGSCARRFQGSPTFLFLGNLKYSANRFGLSLFFNQAMPRLMALRPDAKLLVVGDGVDAALREMASRFGEQVRFLEYVQDLDSVADNCAAMVVPLAFGSGIKLKVVDALARGLPFVSTPYGVEGIDVMDEVHCLIENTIAAFPEAMLRLLDTDLNARLSEAGRTHYAAHLSRGPVQSVYREAILGETWPGRSIQETLSSGKAG